MADDINKKISIDIEINTDGQQQVQQYKTAFNSLRSTISNLNTPLNDISKNVTSIDKSITILNTSINKLNSSGSSFVSTIYKIGTAASSSFANLSGISTASKLLKDAGLIAEEFSAELTGGISLAISFIPVIVDWVSSLFNADTAVQSLTQALTEHQSILNAIKQAHIEGDQNAQQELVNLKTLYSASQDQNLSLNQRKKAVNELQSQYPGYFGNLTSEAILAGKAATAYNTLTQSIIASSRAKAAEDMMVENSKRQITDKSKTDDLQQQIDAKKKELAETIDKYRTAYAKGGRGRGAAPGAEYLGQIREMRDGIIELQKTYNDAANDSTFFANIFCKSKKPLLFLPLQFNIK